MADPTGGGGFEGAKMALAGLAKVVAILVKADQGKAPKLSASQNLKQMGALAHTRALELQHLFGTMQLELAALRDRGYDVSLPLSECRKKKWFYKIAPGAPYKLLREFDTRVNTIANLCDDLFADILAIAECKEGEDEIVAAVGEMRKTVKSLRDVSIKDAPMDQTVQALLDEANELEELTRSL
jgi:hypothetical protein